MGHRIGLIGCGGIAGTWIKAVAEHDDSRIELAYDVDAEAAERRAEEAGARALTDLDELLGSDVDLVIICTPNTTHRELVQRAAAAGKHVMCEKPMALNLADCEQMIAACDTAGVQLAIGHTIRFFGTFLTARRLIAAGAIGAPVAGNFDRMGAAKPRPVGEAGRWTGASTSPICSATTWARWSRCSRRCARSSPTATRIERRCRARRSRWMSRIRRWPR